MPRGPRVRASVKEQIIRLWLADQTRTAKQVLSSLPHGGDAPVPSLRAVQVILQRARRLAPEQESPWTWGGVGAEPAVSPALVRTWALASRYEGIFSRRTAGWVERLAALCPDWEPKDLLWYGEEYSARELVAEVLGRPPRYEDLDGFIAYAPWLNLLSHTRYVAALKNGEVAKMNSLREPEHSAFVRAVGEDVFARFEADYATAEGQLGPLGAARSAYPNAVEWILPSQIQRFLERILVMALVGGDAALWVNWPDWVLWMAYSEHIVPVVQQLREETQEVLHGARSPGPAG